MNQKVFIGIVAFLSIASNALACPNLAGNYTCDSEGTLSITQSGNPITYVVDGSTTGGLDEVSGSFTVGSSALPQPYPAGTLTVSCASKSIMVASSFKVVPLGSQVTYTQTSNGLSIVSAQTSEGQTQAAPAIQCTKE